MQMKLVVRINNFKLKKFASCLGTPAAPVTLNHKILFMVFPPPFAFLYCYQEGCMQNGNTPVYKP